MNKLLFLLFGFVGMFCSNISKAVDFPSYISDPQKVNENIDVILQANEARPEDTQSAINSAEERKDILREYSANLYANALAVRAQMVGTEGASSSGLDINKTGDKVLGELKGQMGEQVGAVVDFGKKLYEKLQSKNKTSILQNELKEPNKNIALRLRQIIELEAAIANLQATQMLHKIDYTTDKEK